MSQFTIESTPLVQYALRLDHQLHNKFYSLSKRTKIPMSTLGRLSITMFLDEVESRGITTVLKEMGTI
jgi:predicted DNA-binding protein